MPKPARPSDSILFRRHRRLRILTLVLLTMITLWFYQYVRNRPTTVHQQRVAAFGYALRLITGHYVEEVTENEIYEAAMRGMFAPLTDRYSSYLSPSETRRTEEDVAGEFGGVGIVVTVENGSVVVTSVREEAPAETAGVKPGDIIVEIDGVSADKFTFPETVSRIRGKVGTVVKLTVQRGGAEAPETYEITRDRISVDNVTWHAIGPDIGYLKVEMFDEDSSDNVRDGLEELVSGGMKGLILDLRHNAGGLLMSAVEVCDFLLKEGAIVRLRGRGPQQTTEYNARPGTAVPDKVPVVVLIDRGTASAAEIVAGALKWQKRATMVGTTTFGKGAINHIYRLPNDSAVLLTVAYYEFGEGQTIEGQGIAPDVVVGDIPPISAAEKKEKLAAWIARYREVQREQLDRAVEVLKQKMVRTQRGG